LGTWSHVRVGGRHCFGATARSGEEHCPATWLRRDVVEGRAPGELSALFPSCPFVVVALGDSAGCITRQSRWGSRGARDRFPCQLVGAEVAALLSGRGSRGGCPLPGLSALRPNPRGRAIRPRLNTGAAEECGSVGEKYGFALRNSCKFKFGRQELGQRGMGRLRGVIYTRAPSRFFLSRRSQ
jgi:hypothetical protein